MTIACEHVFFGTGYLPVFAKETYKIEDSDLSLIGTSEQTLIGYRGDTIINAIELPILVSAFSPCFRTEAGAAGRATRGGYRVHQFHKVEQIVICAPADSERWLGPVPAQRRRPPGQPRTALPSGPGLRRRPRRPGVQEVRHGNLVPSFGAYRETHSNSNLTDYQASRFKIRLRGESGMVFRTRSRQPGITDRAALAILDNYVQPDGSVVVPDVLRPCLGGMERIEAPSRS